MKKQFEIFRSAVLAGILIGIAGFGYLALKDIAHGLVGAIVFSFGLSSVICYKLKLFTGTAGFVQNGRELAELATILIGNIAGCLLVALLARLSPMPITETAEKLLAGRLATGAVKCGALAIGCGFIMTTVVTFARQDKWIPLIFGVPMFIICGFPHSIADIFYYLAAPWSFWGEHLGAILLLYLCVVLGNFIGCNLYRFICWKK